MSRLLVLCTLAVAATLVMVPTAAQAATAKAYNTFTIPRKFDACPEWYEANRPGVLKASNCRIVKDRGDGEYQVLINTPLGACQYIMKETRKDKVTDDGKKVTTYFQKYVRNVSGRVTNSQVTVQFTETGEETKFQMWMNTTVSGRFVPTFAVSNVLQGALNGCEAYVKKHHPAAKK